MDSHQRTFLYCPSVDLPGTGDGFIVQPRRQRWGRSAEFLLQLGKTESHFHHLLLQLGQPREQTRLVTYLHRCRYG
jgi:hypothetical protein